MRLDGWTGALMQVTALIDVCMNCACRSPYVAALHTFVPMLRSDRKVIHKRF